jgi:hypothetical protein
VVVQPIISGFKAILGYLGGPVSKNKNKDLRVTIRIALECTTSRTKEGETVWLA